jgi:hypothetical protein
VYSFVVLAASLRQGLAAYSRYASGVTNQITVAGTTEGVGRCGLPHIATWILAVITVTAS